MSAENVCTCGGGEGKHPAHDWLPQSPCGDACLPDVGAEEDSLHGLALARRIAGMATTFALAPIVLTAPLLPAAAGAGLTRGYARLIMASVGARYQLIDERGSSPLFGDEPARPVADPAGTLVVAPHSSWLDIMALGAVSPMRFVAKGDISGWPLLGPLVERSGTLMHDRERLRAVPRDVAAAAAALRRGETVAVFPEATTWCGTSTGRFRPAYFQAAIDAGAKVQPIEIRYLDAAGRRSTVAAFLGEDALVSSLSRIARRRRTIIEVRLCRTLVAQGDRRGMAALAERSIRGEAPMRTAPLLSATQAREWPLARIRRRRATSRSARPTGTS